MKNIIIWILFILPIFQQILINDLQKKFQYNFEETGILCEKVYNIENKLNEIKK